MCKLSIGIPTYNRAKELIETLNSVIVSLPHDVEIIISVNGSCDNTLDLLLDYQTTYPFIRVCGFKTNQGIDKNIVNLLEHAKGDFVFFLSDDDLVLPETVSKILKTIDLFNPDIIYLNHFPFYNGKIRDRQAPFLSKVNNIFHNGSLFFQKVGLGFLSSLVLKKSKALQYIDQVVYGKECAHLDIACRVALKERGPFIFLGSHSIAARATPSLRYDPFNSCIFNQKMLFDRLFQEKLLRKKIYKTLSRKLLYKDFLKIFLKPNIPSDQINLTLKKIDEHFSEYSIGIFFIKKLQYLNGKPKSGIYYILKKCMVIYRKTKTLFAS